jgi:hypothetical protein
MKLIGVFILIFFLKIQSNAQTKDSIPNSPFQLVIQDYKLQQAVNSISNQPEHKKQIALLQHFVDSFFTAIAPNGVQNQTLDNYEVKGVVRDFNTGEGIPFAQILCTLFLIPF